MPDTNPLDSVPPRRTNPYRRRGIAAIATLAIASSMTALRAQNLVLPYLTTLTESQTQEGISSSNLWWRSVPTRFQAIYHTANFALAGVTGPITITRLRFRAEDGQSNLGGQVYSNVQIQLGTTSVTGPLMSTTLANNAAAATLAPPITTTIVVGPASGTVPNDYVIDIDLAALNATFPFDPIGSQVNLFLDVTIPTAPASPLPLAMVNMQSATPSECGGVYTTNVGHRSGRPPVMAIEILGGGGQPTLLPATNEYVGAACGGAPSAFYERFCTGNPFDLGGGLTITPDTYPSPSTYTVTGGAPPVDRSKVNTTPDSVADNAAVPHNLGFTFDFPGGSTGVVSPDTNGNVLLMSATYSDAFPDIDKFLGMGVTTTYGPRFALFWHDLHAGRNGATHPNSGLHVLTDTSGGPGNAVCYATWLDVGRWNSVSGIGVGGHCVFTMQCAIHEATGVVEFRYGPMSNVVASLSSDISALVGFSRGIIGGFGGVRSVDPQTRDLSAEVPFSTMVEGTTANMRLRSFSPGVFVGPNYGARMVAGRQVGWTIDNLPPGTTLGALMLDLSVTRPGAQVPGLVAPGCIVSLLSSPLTWQVFPLTGVTTATTNPLTVPPGFLGISIYSQFLAIRGSFVVSTNTMKQTIGLP
ncbi:MAG: hypothetical protein U1E73_00110 [Planctomycetota bacterium]